MGKVTSKLQVTVPKVIADRYGIHPGDDIEWSEAGESIRVSVESGAPVGPELVDFRLQLFDQATARQRRRNRKAGKPRGGADRGWSRQDLYDRGRTR